MDEQFKYLSIGLNDESKYSSIKDKLDKEFPNEIKYKIIFTNAWQFLVDLGWSYDKYYVLKINKDKYEDLRTFLQKQKDVTYISDELKYKPKNILINCNPSIKTKKKNVTFFPAYNINFNNFIENPSFLNDNNKSPTFMIENVTTSDNFEQSGGIFYKENSKNRLNKLM